MHDIQATIIDHSQSGGTSSIYLNANQPLLPWTLQLPITWTGQVNGNKVRILQHDYPSRNKDNFEFIGMPDGSSYTQFCIIDLIDECCRVMD